METNTNGGRILFVRLHDIQMDVGDISVADDNDQNRDPEHDHNRTIASTTAGTTI